MIRSSTAPDAQWKCVPDGFQVAWRNVDLAVFQHRSRISAALDRVRQTTTGVADAASVGCVVVCWRALHLLQRGRSGMRQRSDTVLAATRRVIRLGPLKPSKRSWQVTVRITVAQDTVSAPQALAA